MPLAVGEDFAGYRILRLLGSGGMGEVYLAQHPRLPRRDALKILRTDVSTDTDYRARFAREADLASTLWHPHVVGVHDRGERDGQLWITMDYVDGTDAAHVMQHRYPYGMPLPEVLEIVSGIADALDHAHEKHLLHRDVKPANILLSEARGGTRRILLADFGIARAAHDANGLTATGMTLGSVGYAAPEQLMGSPLNGRADQYALACTAFHLICGAPPFPNSNPAVVISNHLSAPPPTLATTRTDLGALDAVLHKAMAKDPAQRFTNCRGFASALAQASAGLSRPADLTEPAMKRTPPPPDVAATPAKQRLLYALGGAAALLVVGLVAFLGARLGQPSPPLPAPPATSSPAMAQPAPPAPDRSSSENDTPSTQAAPPSSRSLPPPPAPQNGGDLGLSQQISHPACNGQGIVVLGSVTTPGLYAEGVQRLLDEHPGASYLRTDQSCPSLRAATAEGNPIYAIFQPAGRTQAQVCAAVNAAGNGAYGKWLSLTVDPEYIIHCD
ncbi:serine/threonine-protein kinase [Mycobacterium sp.]|uniref:serine/threonine-protein kinase n=1 Tax=Mycobacterium sp. TaxID=1785 RepID=UPI002601250F|nr:serine/threonine-protein kinase [Mycobacterium sp.]